MYEKIKAAIRTHTDSHRLVFWYDPQATHRSILEELETGAEILEADNNEWYIKYRVLEEKPQQHFLVYIPSARPDDANNWLLDLLFTGFVFSHDLSETYREECGLDTGFREFFQRHIAFFRNSRERFLPLQEMIDPKQETVQSLARKMIGILASSPADQEQSGRRFENLLFEIAEEELNGLATRWNAVEKFELDSWFRDELTLYIPEISATITPLGAVLEVFRCAWAFETGEAVTASGRSSRLLLQQWRDSFSVDRRYYAMAEYVQNTLGISAQIASYPVERLAELTLFPAVDSELAKKLVELVLQPHADTDSIRTTAAGRLSSSRLQNGTGIIPCIYTLIVSYIDFEKELHKADLSPGAQAELFSRYTERMYHLDSLYRRALFAYRAAGSLGSLAAIIDRIEGRYSQHFLQPLAEIWDKALNTSGSPVPAGVMMQERFFKDVVKPSLNRGEKLVVVISDALRYEAGCELKERLAALNRIQAAVEPVVAAIPTVTAVGMNALLPHETLQIEKSGEVRINGQHVAGIEGRSNYLREYVASHFKGKKAAAFWADHLLRLPTTAARELVAGIDVLYLYSNGIDAAADNAKTEASLPDAVAAELDTLEGVVKKFANQLNRTHILITADHGFLYQNEKPADAFMLTAENPAYGYRERRYVMGTEAPGAHFFSPATVSHPDSAAVLYFAEGLYRIRKQGGGTRYIHGGLSLQELTLPLIRVRVGRTDDVTPVGVAIMVPTNAVITTPVYKVTFFQEEPVSEKRPPLRLSVFFAAEDGTRLSERIEMNFDSADPNAQNRSSSAEFNFGPQVNKYNGKRIQLVLEKLIGGTSLPYTSVNFTFQTFGERDF